MDAVAASCDARSGRIEVEVGTIRSIDRSRGTECPKSGAACRSEVGWSGMKGMFYVVIPRGPGPDRGCDSSGPRSRRVSLGFTGRDSSLMRDMCLFWYGATHGVPDWSLYVVMYGVKGRDSSPCGSRPMRIIIIGIIGRRVRSAS